MEGELAPKTWDTDGQETGLRYRQSSVLPHGSIRRIVIIGENGVAAVIAAKEKDADQGLVIPLLCQRREETKTLQGQGCRAKRGKGSTDQRSPCKCHVTLLLRLCQQRDVFAPAYPRLRRRRGVFRHCVGGGPLRPFLAPSC